MSPRYATQTTVAQSSSDSPRDLRQPPQTLCVIGGERAGDVAPGPVLVAVAGVIHSRFGAEAEDVLDGDDGGLRDGRECGADQRPLDLSRSVDAEVVFGEIALGLRRVGEPAARRVVVVRPGVDHRLLLVAVRKMWAVHLAEG